MEDNYTTVYIRQSTLKRLADYQKKKKLRTRDDALNDLIDKISNEKN